MRIEAMLADLEAQERARRQGDVRAEVAESVRAEWASITLWQRLHSSLGEWIVVKANGIEVAGHVIEVGDGWLALSRIHDVPAAVIADVVRPGFRIVAIDAIESVVGLPPSVRTHSPSLRGLSWRAMLRAVARSRGAVAWQTRSGSSHTGVIRAVGADHVILTKPGGDEALLSTASLTVLAPMSGGPDRLAAGGVSSAGSAALSHGRWSSAH